MHADAAAETGHQEDQIVRALRERAVAVRRRVIQMVQALGHGYLGQGLGAADMDCTGGLG